MNNLLFGIFILAMMISVYILKSRRKKENITGFKTLLTSLCFYSIAILNMLAYKFHFLGLVTFTASIILLFLAAYFMKYLPRKEEHHEV